MEFIAEVANLSKDYYGCLAVDNLSFSINRAEVLGFVGPNGAGKTTTIKMMLGLVRPSAGQIRLCGTNLQDHFETAISLVGGIVEYPAFYPYMSGYDNLMLASRMQHRSSQSRLENLIDLVGLAGRINDPVRQYSLGMKQRLGICRVLLGCPELLILDEPTNGLDPDGVIEFRDIIKTVVAEEKVSVLISGHILAELDKICDRALLIDQGRLVSTIDLARQNDHELYRISTRQADLVLSLASRSDSWQAAPRQDGSLTINVKTGSFNDLLKQFLHEGIVLDAISTEHGILENDYISLIRSQKDGTHA